MSITNAVRGSAIETIDKLITDAVGEPMTVETAKSYLRFTSTSEDAIIGQMITAARQYWEDQTGVITRSQTWEHSLSGTPDCAEIELPKAPLQSITSITYDDSDGVEQTVDADTYGILTGTASATTPGRVRLVSGAAWPSFTVPTSAGFRIRYVAGYGDDASDVPQIVVWAIGMIMAAMHRFRAELHEQQGGTVIKVPFGAEQIIRDYRWRNRRTLVPRYSAWL